jgi:hypothetical protein
MSLSRPLPLAFPAGWRARILSGLPRRRPPCDRGEPGADGRFCPYREHALISRQEHEAWDVLLACQGQLRLAPSGHVVGLDVSVALRLAVARGYDLGYFPSCCRRPRPALWKDGMAKASCEPAHKAVAYGRVIRS